MEEVKKAKEEAETAKEQADKMRQEAEESKMIALNAKIEIENAKKKVEEDLDILQKRSQNELIGIIVKVSLSVIVGVAFITTAVYLIAMFSGKDTQVVASTWSNIIGILLTNAFSIIGTIMGVKYATEDKKKD
jgi:branched-subunit amino acid permease